MSNALIEAPADEQQQSVGMAIATTRQAQEVQAAMIVAKRFPRDEDLAASRILKACKRPGLAEAACYEYSKGGTKITGPSIRLAEVMAQNWGNIDFGFVELERSRGVDGVGVSIVQAHAWDMETNTRRAATFNVRHWRDTRQGGYALDDEREIYEAIANQAARRVRACVLAVIPGDIQDAAVEQCEKTLAGQSTEPLTDRIRKMISAFDEVGVSKAQIELKLGHATSAITNSEMARLTKIFTSIRDGFGTVAEHFPSGEPKSEKKSMEEIDKQLKPAEKKEPAKEPTQAPVADKPTESTDDWDSFKQLLVKAVKDKSIASVQAARKHGFEKFPDRQEEVNTLCDESEFEIRESRGEKSNKPKQGKLMDTNPTA